MNLGCSVLLWADQEGCGSTAILGREGMAKQILVDPDKFLGEPYIEGTGLPVSAVMQLTEAGLGPEEICAAYPELSVEDVKAAMDHHAKHGVSAS
jgi:uncharacterized protein (DUF433 family)